jgi:hypothetical protein
MFKLNKKSEPTTTEKPAETTVEKVEDKSEAKPVEPDTQPKPEPKKAEKKVDLSKETIKNAIAQGKAIIKEGKSKADAARAIYALLKDEGKEVIVTAFMEGATLTQKGSVTYWYNCKRKADKEAKKSTTG